MIEEHIEDKAPENGIPWNRTGAKGNTVLDYAALAVGRNRILGEDQEDLELDKAALKAQRKAGVKVYEFLRERGALHRWELKGNVIA